MNAQHTPGPWSYGRRNLQSQNSLDVWSTTKDSTGAYITVGVISGATCESEVDARLIASAPDLLAALEAMVDRHSNLMAKQICKCDACKLAKAAIAKAKGEA